MNEWINKIHQGHALQVLKQMPGDLVDMVITSPPYFGLREYGTDPQVWGGDPLCEHEWEETVTEINSGMMGMNERVQKEANNKDSKFVGNEFDKPKQNKSSYCRKCNAWKGELGLEPGFNEYVEHLVSIFDEVKRVMKPTGSCYVNIGDTYGGACSRASYGGRAGFGTERETVINRGYDKCLLMIPERFSIKMIEHGWILRNKIIWYKPNAMPSSVDDRLKNTYEFIFHFVKNKKYYYNLDAIREEPSSVANEANKSEPSDPIVVQEEFNMDLGNNENAQKKEVGVRTSPKYEEKTGHSNRQGLNRELDTVTLKAYKEYQQPIARFLKKHLTIAMRPRLDSTFGKHKWGHWMRTDLSGAALPGVEDWKKLKEIMQFDDTFDEKIYEVQKLNIPVFTSGKNPGDFIEDKKPYAVQDRDKEFVEYRNLPPIKEISAYLNKWRIHNRMTIEEIEQKLDSRSPHHWFNGESYPSAEDWERIKALLEFDYKYDEAMTTTYWKSSEKQDNPMGKNPGDVFEISTQPFPGSHFAVFPESLCLKPILSSCPDEVCSKCGKPRVKVYTKGDPVEEWKKNCGADSKGEYTGQGKKDYAGNKVQNPSDVKRRILEGMRERKLTGYIACECGEKFVPGIVMDIFAGSGTALLVASGQRRFYIGIELNPKYIDIALGRLEKEGNPLFIKEMEEPNGEEKKEELGKP